MGRLEGIIYLRDYFCHNDFTKFFTMILGKNVSHLLHFDRFYFRDRWTRCRNLCFSFSSRLLGGIATSIERCTEAFMQNQLNFNAGDELIYQDKILRLLKKQEPNVTEWMQGMMR